VLKYFIIGAFGGAITGVPIGPVNIAVIDTAYRHHLKRAVAVALGGAIADMLYALVGILWFGPLINTRPHIAPILYGISGVALIIYGIMNLRAAPADPARHSADKSANQPYFWSGFGLGMALILLNPSTLLAWVVFFGSWMADVDQASGIAAAVGIGCGSFAWFGFVAMLAHRGKQFLQKKSQTINRAVGLFLMGFGVYSIGKAAHYWLYVA
jgi:threonine/homoserine/homoserine lactone efflux protein